MKKICALIVFMFMAAGPIPSLADEAAEMARKMQDPLANIKALVTDNDISFNTGNDETSYGFQLQPIYAISFDDQGFNLVNRAVIPILGMADGGQIRRSIRRRKVKGR